MKRIIMVIVGVLAVVAIGIFVLIKLYVTPESIKKFLVPYAEQALNRKVDIGEIKIGFLQGIDVKDFTVKEVDGQTDFVTCKDFILKFQLLPLLSRKVVIDELKIINPEVRVSRSSKGKFNFEGIGRKEKSPETKKMEPDSETKGLPVSLLVKTISVKDARFSLVDATKKLPDIRGSFALDSTITGADGSSLSSSGRISTKLDEVLLPKKQLKDIVASLDYAVKIGLESNNIRVEKADLKVQDIVLLMTGDLNSFKKDPAMDMAFKMPDLNLSDLQKNLMGLVDIKGMTLSGKLSADVRIKGKPDKPDSLNADGQISLEKTGIQAGNVNAVLNGRLGLNGQSVSVDMKGNVGQNTLDIKGSAGNLFKSPDIVLNLYSKQLVLDELIPGNTASSKTAPPDSGKASKEAGPLDLKLSAKGEIKVDSATYKNMKMSDFFMKYQFRENKLEIERMTAVAGRGKLNVSSRVDLAKPGYTYALSGNLDSLHADEFVNSLFPKAKDTVFGTLSGDLRLNGAGTLPDSIRKNLAGEVNFNLNEGKITNAKISENLATFLNIEELRTINLKQARGVIKIKDGIARLDSILVSDDIAMDPSGDIGLNETLDLSFDLKLSPRLSKKTVGSGVAKYIKDEEGWGMIPLKISGTFAQPSYTVDIAKAGKRVIKKELNKVIDKLFAPDTKGEETGEGQEKKPDSSIFRNIFK